MTNQATKPTRLYDEYRNKSKKDKDRMKQIIDATDKEIELIKRYLDEEETFVLDDRKKEKGITEDVLEDIRKKFKKLDEDNIDPLKKKIDDLGKVVGEEQKLEEKGVNDVELDDILDEDDGIKQGLKVKYLTLLDHFQ